VVSFLILGQKKTSDQSEALLCFPFGSIHTNPLCCRAHHHHGFSESVSHVILKICDKSTKMFHLSKGNWVFFKLISNK
jgi:hypothetical protein